MATYNPAKNMFEQLFNEMEEKFLQLVGLAEETKVFYSKMADEAMKDFNAKNRATLENVNRDLAELIKKQAAEAAKKAEEDASFARFQKAREAELDRWHRCLDAWLRFVRQDPRNKANRQLAFAKAEVDGKDCFFMRFAEAEDRINEMWLGGPDYRDDALLFDLEVLYKDCISFKANFCKEFGCGVQIPLMITPRKGRPFPPSKCQAHAPHQKKETSKEAGMDGMEELRQGIADANSEEERAALTGIFVDGKSPLDSVDEIPADQNDSVAEKPEPKKAKRNQKPEEERPEGEIKPRKTRTPRASKAEQLAAEAE